mmetsp:Transcript_14164/g.30904  ORF Transcript_14164/g.30904 Transcript_14164/m.30904 type:complete len:390 (+) Transcript_14164:242-1411(+)
MTQSIAHSIRSVVGLFLLTAQVAGWGNSGGSFSYSIYGNSFSRDWLYNSKGISIEVHGCLWSYMKSKEDDDAGCLEESSEDGTDVWYQMSNCRRAQVAWSVYASDGSSSPSCNSGNYKESFVTTTSVNDFIGYIGNYYGFTEDNYGGYYPMCGNNGGGGGGGGGGGRNLGYPEGISCGSDASFQIEQFADSYCLTRTGNVVDSLNYLNKDMSNLQCLNVYGNNDGRRKLDGSVVQYLIAISESCSSWDSGLCKDSAAAEERHSYSGSSGSAGVFHHKALGSGGHTWFTKLKYVSGGLLLLASFVMFTGILFTNRRRRRALMQRKYRQAKRSGRSGRSVDGRSRRSSRSASKHRDASSRKSSSRSRRSKSRTREGASPKKSSEEAEGVLT